MSFVIVNMSDHGGYSLDGWVEIPGVDDEGWGPFATLDEANAAEKRLIETWPTYEWRGRRRPCDRDLRIVTLKPVP